MIRRHRQCPDLSVVIVALVEWPEPSPDETDNTLPFASDARAVVFIAKYRLQPLAHLAGRCSVAQVGDKLRDSLRIGDRGVTDCDPKTKAVPLRFTLPLESLTPGRYDCQVSVLNATAQKVAFWRAPIVVVP
jgi:hypothetical protein